MKAWFIGIAHSADLNISKPEKMKLTKYNPLADEYKKINKQQSVGVMLLMVIATSLESKNFVFN